MRKNPKAYLFLLAAILLLMSLPKSTGEKIQGRTVASFAPVWNSLTQWQRSITTFFSGNHSAKLENEEMQNLKLSNLLLKAEISRLQLLLQQENYLLRQVKELPADENPRTEKAINKHIRQIKEKLNFQLQALPASVIFRSPSSWYSTLWLNVGKENNPVSGAEIIARNSPVVIGDSIVGLVDYVGEKQCRVRLITDSGLTPSVRAQRGSLLLAKGELYGDSKPLWRMGGQILHGVGFNYDFNDDEGVARDLRSGIPINSNNATEAIPLLQVNDILVTTGMDGIFPSGWKVAEVTHVSMLREGDYYYELEAKPTAGNLQELSLVYVIPPLGYNEDDQPSLDRLHNF